MQETTRTSLIFTCLLTLRLAVPLPGFAQEGLPLRALSLDDALSIALDRNPEYGILASGLETLDWRRREAWGSFVPSATISNFFGYTAGGDRQFGDFTLGTRPAQLASVYNLGLSLSLNGAAIMQPSVVSAQEQVTRAQVDGASAALLDEVTRAYLSALQADEELEQARAEVERTSAYVAQAETQAAVGAATPLDIRRAETQQGQALVLLLQAENSVIATRLALMRSIGAEVSTDLVLTSQFEVFDPDLGTQELLDLALARNPDLRASRSEAASARTQTRIAQTQYLPTLSLSAGWSGSVFKADEIGPLVSDALGQLNGRFEGCVQNNRVLDLLGDPPLECGALDPSDPAVAASVRTNIANANSGFPFSYDTQPVSFSANVSLPLFTGFSRQLQIEEARVAADNAQRQVRAEELRLQAEIEGSLRAVQTAQRIAELQARIRETSAEELRLAEERFRLGLATSIEVVDAQANLSQAERDEIFAIYDFHISFTSLETLVGVPLRD